MGVAANFTVVLDGVPLYGLAVDEHVVLRVPPGDHVVTISRRGPLLNDAGGVQRVDKPGVTETRLWGSYEKVTVIRRAAAEEGKR